MAAVQEDDPPPSIRFKRRKIAHPKRVNLDDDVPTISTPQTPGAATPSDARSPPQEAHAEEDSVPNLREILRNRKRPRDRLRESARKAEPPRTEVAQVNAPRPDQYTSRFVAQTGQVVERDDKQMTQYVEARMAEQNYRQYGWPIPTNLQAAVATIAPDLKHTFTATSSTQGTQGAADNPADRDHSNRLAAGQGKLHEVDLGPDAAARTEQAWKRLDGTEPAEESKAKSRLDKYGYQWRKPKRRNSDAMRREQMVEAVLREAKLDYFDDTAPTNPFSNNSGSSNNDDAIAERFRLEYYENMQEQQQRKPPPPASGMKGVKEAPKGPKLGGSKSARAKILKAQEEAAKGKR
ncbi:uncharacterized protein K460DRAFT_375300 [Cucurbitaria berberidis CBS 394.84]|uniref:Uncharacterized protein n=1 Tax=Cucurbitaria berberidis CBS 394.84 TaxID=1168544 RepID=A0A9P4LAI9_9PLEO|nr:uncharacterized protein K460DRAFT_375300 [Cucurbitaria berberidis CBS 394.84]KAF1848436.1 hypothetical protein K460DRAFT_375300 [Cucurbitaria berberidis CBS 394.84]